MRRFKEFYYEEEISSEHYSSNPKGLFVADRLVRGKSDCFKSLESGSVLKPRKLILADWGARNWDSEKTEQVKQKLKIYMENGFVVYLWQNGELMPLDEENISILDDKDVRQQITPSDSQHIYETALKNNLGIPKNQIKIIDNYWMNRIIAKEDNPSNTIKIGDLLGMSNEEIEMVVDILKNSKPSLTKIIENNYSPGAIAIQNALYKHFPRNLGESKYERIDFNTKMCILIHRNKKIMAVNNTTGHTFIFKWNDLRNISSAKLEWNASLESDGYSLDFFLSSMPQLKSVLLLNCPLKFEDNKPILPSLEEITVESCSMRGNSFNNILKRSPNIKKILFKGPYDFDLKKLGTNLDPLKSVEEFVLDSAFMTTLYSAVDIANALKIFPNLKKISFANSSIGFRAVGDALARVLNENTSMQENIEEINLNRTFASISKLLTSLQRCSNLKKLSLAGCDIQNIGEIELNTVEDMVLDQAKFPEEKLGVFLTKTPKLKKISFAGIFFLKSPELKEKSLPNIESVRLTSSNISSIFINNILMATPNLKKIDLDEISDFPEMSLPPNSLKYLQYINLKKSGITLKRLTNILQAAPNIKKISLEGCKYISGKINLKSMDLSNLEEIDLKESNINDEGVESLLKAAPNIKKISLEDCKNISGKINLESMDLSNLEEINLSRTSINDEGVESLLKAAPNIKKISLQTCKNITGKLNLAPKSLNDLKQLDLPDNLHPNFLGVLINAAPNLKKIKIGSSEFDITTEQGYNALLHHLQKPYKKTNMNVAHSTAHNREDSRTPIIRNPLALQDPTHNPLSLRNFKPTKSDFEHTFKKHNKALNQDMIVNKLSQYFIITNENLHLIPGLQDGICSALVHLFDKTSSEKWKEMIQQISQWDGERQTLNSKLEKNFKAITHDVHMRQFHKDSSEKRCFIGDNVSKLFSHNKPLILTNPWHEIIIRPTKNRENHWDIYDPNYVHGYKTVHKNKLEKVINKSIGHLISVKVDGNTKEFIKNEKPLVNDKNAFIENGGLFSLYYCDNSDELFKFRPESQSLSKKQLEGIFIRTTQGYPAWILGLRKKELSQYTLSLIKALKEKSGASFKKDMQKSLEALNELQRHEIIVNLIQSKNPELHELIDIIRNAPGDIDAYKSYFKTWKTQGIHSNDTKAYTQHIIKTYEGKKLLIQLEGNASLEGIKLALQSHCESKKRKIYLIDKPEDLVCASPYIARAPNGEGKICKGPGGPLYDFLMQNFKNPPILVVNYSNFKARDIIKFNALLDDTREADGTPLPKQTTVIGLMNPDKPECYQGADFYSRFDEIIKCPINKNQLTNLRLPFETESKKTVSINLYHSSNWKELLLGRWILDGDKLTYQEGELQKALKNNNKPIIEIKNGLWEDEEFTNFWLQACHQEKIYHAGQFLKVKGTKLIKREGYDWKYYTKIIDASNNNLNGNRVPLNPSQINSFFVNYDINENKMKKKPGIIESNTKKTLPVYLTRTISKDAWAMVLDECIKHDTKLNITYAPGVEIPPEVSNHISMTTKKTEETPFTQKHVENLETRVIHSTDIDTTLAQLTKNPNENRVVIDISECDISDLLIKTNGELNKTNLCFEFTQSTCELLTALNQGKEVILKGNFSESLIDGLAPFLLERETEFSPKGSLVIVSDNKNLFPYIKNEKHDVSEKEKWDCLDKNINENYKNTLQPYIGEPLSQLKVRYSSIAKSEDINKPWIGMNDLSGAVSINKTLDLNKSQELAEAFLKKRLNSVKAVLDEQPYVFLTGLTGVGKSTFVEKELCATNDTLYKNEENIEAWAKDCKNRNKYKYLFIDEANLSPRQWSEFEGLFSDPRGILINGTFQPLTDKHKVVFAGNPVSYGDERELAPFFSHHGNAVLFSPLSPEVIYEKILKPVFVDELLTFESEESEIASLNRTLDAESISKRILEAYLFICSCSEIEVLISPREVQMMAMMICSYYQNNQNVPLADITDNVIYYIAKNLVPKHMQSAFDNEFKPKNPLKLNVKEKIGNNFIITESRKPTIELLDQLLKLRNFRIKGHNDAQKYGGLGGILIEGLPGIGKTEMVIKYLVEQNYQEEKDFNNETQKSKPFYRMPVSMSLSEKINLLDKAFDEGAIVLIDEINSSPMMERTLNDLLMGKNSQGSPPKKPGFMIIGTQNPPSMGWRHKPSTALARRMMKIDLPEYTQEELEYILQKRGVVQIKARQMTQAYIEQKIYAKRKGFSPPTFRSLMRLADKEIELQNNIEKLLKFTIKDKNEQISKLDHVGFFGKDTQSPKDKIKNKLNELILTHLSVYELAIDSVNNKENTIFYLKPCDSNSPSKIILTFQEDNVYPALTIQIEGEIIGPLRCDSSGINNTLEKIEEVFRLNISGGLTPFL